MDVTGAPYTYKWKWTRRVLLLLAGLLLSALVACATAVIVTNVDSAGYFQRWERLPDPPAAVVDLALDEAGILYARLDSKAGRRATACINELNDETNCCSF
jgi:hypothetical protein